MIRLLIINGADVNHHNKWGQTALMRAISDYKIDAMFALLESDQLDLNIQDREGKTALIYTIQKLNNWDNQEKIVQLLLEKGADINIKDKNGKTALVYAIENGDKNIEKMLVKTLNN